MNFRITSSSARALNTEGIIPGAPHEWAAYESPSVAQFRVTTAALAPFSANSDVRPIDFSEGVIDQLAVTPKSYPVASYG
jgi:hypothetical protein